MARNNIHPNTKVYTLLQPWVSNIEERDFFIERPYKVRSIYDQPRGKWTGSIADSIYVDCRYIFPAMIGTLTDNIIRIMERSKSIVEGANDNDFAIMESLLRAYESFFKSINPNDMAMTANVKFRDSMQLYMQDVE